MWIMDEDMATTISCVHKIYIILQMFMLKLLCVGVVVDTLYFSNKESKTQYLCVIEFSIYNLTHILTIYFSSWRYKIVSVK